MTFVRARVLVSILILLISMCACGAPSSLPSSSESPSSSSVADIPIQNIGITKEDIITTLDRRLSEQGYPTISKSLRSTLPHTIEGVEYIYDFYGISDGIFIFFISDTEGNVIQFTYLTDDSKIKLGAAMLGGYLVTTLPYVFDPVHYEELYDVLHMFAEGDVSRYTENDTCHFYYYTKPKDSTRFEVSLPGSESMDIFNLDYSQGDVTEPEIDWTLDSFVDYLNEFNTEGMMPKLDISKMGKVPVEELEGLSPDIMEGGYFDLGKSSRMYLYTSACGRLERIEFILLKDKMDEASISAFGFGISASTHTLEPEKAKDVLNTINIADLTSESPRMAPGGKMDFYYSYDSDLVLCTISRQSPWLSFSPVTRPTTPPTVNEPDKASAQEPTDERVPPVCKEYSEEDVSVPAPDKSAAPLKITGGGLYLDLDIKMNPIGDAVTEFYSNENIYAFVYFDRPIEKVVPRITWQFPDGTVLKSLPFGIEGSDRSFRGFVSDTHGLGQGSVTIEHNGEVLATYPFEVIE